MGASDVSAVGVGPVTAAEVATFVADGWVLLPRLIDAGTAAELRALATTWMGAEGDAHLGRDGVDIKGFAAFANYFRPDKDDDLFRQVAVHPQMGRNAAALLQTDLGIRLFTTLVTAKLPRDMETQNAGKGETATHQHGLRPFRSRSIQIWIALGDMTPRMGTLRFPNGLTPLRRDGRALRQVAQSRRMCLVGATPCGGGRRDGAWDRHGSSRARKQLVRHTLGVQPRVFSSERRVQWPPHVLHGQAVRRGASQGGRASGSSRFSARPCRGSSLMAPALAVGTRRPRLADARASVGPLLREFGSSNRFVREVVGAGL
jgi:hypothetical protein